MWCLLPFFSFNHRENSRRSYPVFLKLHHLRLPLQGIRVDGRVVRAVGHELTEAGLLLQLALHLLSSQKARRPTQRLKKISWVNAKTDRGDYDIKAAGWSRFNYKNDCPLVLTSTLVHRGIAKYSRRSKCRMNSLHHCQKDIWCPTEACL